MKYLILIVLLSACGKQPTGNTPTVTPTPTPSVSRPVVETVECSSSVSFLDVRNLIYRTITNQDGSRSVSCTAVDAGGNSYTSTETYDTTQTADRYFAVCRIYYKTAYWLRFDSPGYYVTSEQDKNPLTNGWHVSGMPEYPSNGLTFANTTCSGS